MKSLSFLLRLHQCVQESVLLNLNIHLKKTKIHFNTNRFLYPCTMDKENRFQYDRTWPLYSTGLLLYSVCLFDERIVTASLPVRALYPKFAIFIFKPRLRGRNVISVRNLKNYNNSHLTTFLL